MKFSELKAIAFISLLGFYPSAQAAFNCDQALQSSVGKNIDASSILQSCIDATPEAQTLELPAGIYLIKNQIHITRAMTLKTKARDFTSAPCSINDTSCAEIRAANDFNAINPQSVGILKVTGSRVLIDHLIINGNRAQRSSSDDTKECVAGRNARGFNLSFLDCSFSRFENSVTENAVCGTGFLVGGKTSQIRVINNTIAFNGVHDLTNLWSDGLTQAGDSDHSSFIGNHFIDNTDIDLIFGGCTNCQISNNEIHHTDSFAGGSYAAIMLQAWPKSSDGSGGTPGNYLNSDISHNTIDCGTKQRCGFGIYIGQQAWYNAQVYFGSVHNNLIQNAQLGINIDQDQGTILYDNSIIHSGGRFRTGCDTRQMGSYNIGSGVTQLDTSKNTIAMTSLTRNAWANGCVPNMPDHALIDKVREAYATLLARTPDDSGEENFYNLLLSKKSMRSLLIIFFNSPEFQNALTNDNTSFVTLLYQRLLGRSPDREGLNAHLNALRSQSRLNLFISFIDSAEFKSRHPLLTN